MFIEAHRDHDFLELIKSSEIVTPDGKPLTWALQSLYGIKQDRVAGMDLLPDLLTIMSEQHISAYFYGGEPEVLDKAKIYLKDSFPKLNIAGFYSPPFRDLTLLEENKIIEEINKTLPSVVFVILGCPKQEKWMASMKGKINTVMIGIGGALPVMLGIQKRAPRWMQDAGLEWLFRLSQEPLRLFKRYWQTNNLFVWIFLKEFFKIKIFKYFNGKKQIKENF
jgi:N-acetylglucosaminyldiphosphoundecaprenol N-acetyl-beta-D-mannosaminyltransferase